jgi:serine/threonine protein kinase
MGSVYLGEDVRGNKAAIKALDEIAPTHVESIRREVRLLKEIRHPNIVRYLYDALDEDIPWYAMEYVEGVPLSELIDGEHAETLLVRDSRADETPTSFTTRPLERPSWLLNMQIIPGILAGLNAIHAVGVIHRDIKPGNIVLRPDLTPVLIDFGIAGMLGGMFGREELVDVPGFGATPAYAPPEQQSGETVDARADLYALGAVIFEVLTGQLPYRAKTAAQMYEAHREDPIPSVRDHNPDVPIALDELVQDLLAKDPRDRPGFAVDVDARLRTILCLPAPEYKPANYIYHPSFTGRESEIAALQEFIVQTAQGKSLLAHVRGPAGIGKTRLLQELIAQSPSYVQVVVVQSHGMNRTVDRAWNRLNMGRYDKLAPLTEPVTDAANLRSMRYSLEDAAHKQPLIVVFDDAPKMDEESMMVLTSLVSGPIPRLSVIISMRSDDMEAMAFDGMPVDLALNLKELTRTEVARVLESMLGLQEVPAQYLELVIEHSQGNPYVVADFVRHAIETGLLNRVKGRWEFSLERPLEVARDLPVPARLSQLFFQRFIRLTPDERDVLFALSVCGDGAPEAMVNAVAESLDPLNSLIQKELIYPVDDSTIRLCQPRMVQVILDSMDPIRMRQYIIRAQAWLNLHPRHSGHYLRIVEQRLSV